MNQVIEAVEHTQLSSFYKRDRKGANLLAQNPNMNPVLAGQGFLLPSPAVKEEYYKWACRHDSRAEKKPKGVLQT